MFPWFLTQKSIFTYILNAKWQFLDFRGRAHFMTSWWRHKLFILVSMERGYPYRYPGSKFRVILPSFHIDNLKGVSTTPFGKYIWGKCSGELGLSFMLVYFFPLLCYVLFVCLFLFVRLFLNYLVLFCLFLLRSVYAFFFYFDKRWPA